MRRLLGLMAAFLFTGAPIDAPAQSASGPAPADEYFGAHHESILGIRNRLDRLDARSDADMYAPTSRMELDDLQDAIMDWQHQYPNDPWLPHTFARLLNNYQRAGGAATQRAQAAFAVMQGTYPGSEETTRMLAMGYGGQPSAQGVAPIAAPPTGHGVWLRFDQSRSGVGQPTPPPQ